MKKTLLFIAAAVAALSMVSCQKSTVENVSKETETGKRLITVAFPTTKTTPTIGEGNVLQPVWKEGDVIRVVKIGPESEESEQISITSADAGKSTISFTTSIQGKIAICYPGDDTNFSKRFIYGNGNVSPSSPAESQTGLFADATPCMAELNEGESNATLTPCLGLFKVAIPIGTTSLEAKYVFDPSRDNDEHITINGNSATTTVSNIESGTSEVYISVFSNNLTDIKVKALLKNIVLTATTSTGKLVKKLSSADASKTIDKGAYYTITATGWVPEGFVDLGVVANGKSLYWAEKNLGASSVANYGKYFSWGETGDGREYLDYLSFNWNNDVFGANFEKVAQETACPGNILASAYDAATAKNSAWRMPTVNDFKELASSCVWIWSANYGGIKGWIVYKAKSDGDKGKAKKKDGNWVKFSNGGFDANTGPCPAASETYSSTDTHVFIPAAGFSDSNFGYYDQGDNGYYWTSESLTSPAPYNKFSVYVYSLGTYATLYDVEDRYIGRSIRPVCEAE